MRIARTLITLSLIAGLVALAVPAGAETSCARLVGRAELNVVPNVPTDEASGTARVVYGGTRYTVDITEGDDGNASTVTQLWDFGDFQVTLVETFAGLDTGGSKHIIRSTVEAASPDSSNGMTFRGVFDTDTFTANYVVNGELCLNS